MACIVIYLLANINNVNYVTFILNLTMVQGLFHIDYIDGAHWTLLVFLQFYILCSAYLWLIKKIRIKDILEIWLLVGAVIPLLGNELLYKIMNRLFLLNYSALLVIGIFI